MSKLTDIEQQITQLEGGAFQRMCDCYLSAEFGYKNPVALGSQAGTNKTTKGTPDTYFTTNDGKYIFVVYTAQATGDVFKKIFADIKSCFDKNKAGIDSKDIVEIIYCHTSSNINACQDQRLKKYCEKQGVLLRLIGINTIASDLYRKYHIIARDHLHISITTDQILAPDDFVNEYSRSATTAAPLDTEFQFRNKETEEIRLFAILSG